MELDGTEGHDRPTYRAGDTIRGRVRVRPRGDGRCHRLRVTLGWHTTRADERDHDELAHHEFTDIALEAGVERDFDFELAIPERPFTRRDAWQHVAFCVSARAEIPWATDPRVELPIHVHPPDAVHGGPFRGEAPMDAGQERDADATETRSSGFDRLMARRHRSDAWGAIAIVGFLVVSFLFAAYAAIVLFGPIVDAIVIAMVLFAACGGIVMAAQSLARPAMGDVAFKISPSRAWPGAELRLTLMLAPPRRHRFNKIRASLVCEKTSIMGSGDDRESHTRTLSATPVDVLAEPRDASRVRPLEIGARIVVPEDARPSEWSEDGGISWHVRLAVDVHRWPDYQAIRAITVASEPEQASAED